ncbi:hypothetical protein ACFLQN_02600 [Candidatus Aenigmatarchaeota archaeon]
MTKAKLMIIAIFGIVLLAGTASAQFNPTLCIDISDPEVPGNLIAQDNVDLSWNAAYDEPEPTDDCPFGIDYYNIQRDDVFIDTSSVTSFSDDSLVDGTYVYKVTAVDLGGNEGEPAIIEYIVTTAPPPSGDDDDSPGGSPGGSPSSSPTPPNNNNGAPPGDDDTGDDDSPDCTEDWECTEWSECTNDYQTRTCFDNNECGTEIFKPSGIKECQEGTNDREAGVTDDQSGLPVTALLIGSLADPMVAFMLLIAIIIVIYVAYRITKKKEFKYKKR